MSLSTPPKTYAYAIIAPKNLDDPSFLEEQIGGNLAAIDHVYTNGANDLVIAFARENGIPCTIYPLNRSNLYTSTNLILDKVAAVYLVSSPESKSAAQVREVCQKRGVAVKVLPFEPCSHWKEKACRAAEILEAVPKDEVEGNAALKALKGVL